MKDLTVATSTMSSREIAELCGKRHDNVMTDIRNMLELLKIQSPEFLGDYKDYTVSFPITLTKLERRFTILYI